LLPTKYKENLDIFVGNAGNPGIKCNRALFLVRFKDELKINAIIL
jgi:hypothetical protein